MPNRRKPDEVHILEGTFRSDRHGDTKDIAASGNPIPPKSLKGDARKIWDDIVPQLIAMGTAKQLDAEALVCYCRYVVIHRNLIAMAEKAKTVMGKRHASLTRQIKDYDGMIAKLRQSFGMDCLARTRLRQPVEKKAEKVMARKRG